jgi:hypothetical protein
MIKNAIVFSSDVRFKRMLELELASIGFDIISEKSESNDDLYVLIDLDDETPKGFYSIINAQTVIGFSKSNVVETSDIAQICDSFLNRPFMMRELFALLGHTPQYTTIRTITHQSPEPGVKRLSIDENSKSAIYGDDVIPLSENEYLVLSALCQNRGQTVERSALDAMLGSDGSNMGDVYICHLRKKIDNNLGIKLIYTVRGKGYMLKQ